jgi:hypothetical protein
MKTAAEMEAARRVLLEAMKSFIFDISRDIQLAEEQLTAFPQQVYIVSRSLDWRLVNSGLSAEIFPDFQDKEYVFKTQKKITEVIGKSKASLTQPQIQIIARWQFRLPAKLVTPQTRTGSRLPLEFIINITFCRVLTLR